MIILKQKTILFLVIAAILCAVFFTVKNQKPAAAENSEICAFAQAHNIKLSDYPQEIVALFERNPEARDFALNYPLKKDAEFDTAVSLPEDGSVPLYLQWDERWGYERYSGEIMGLSGCGPTALSMAASYLLNDEALTPKYIADFSEKFGYACYKNGTSWTLISEGAEKLGLSSEEVPLWEASMAAALSENKLIICAMGKGDFTSTGHFILLAGYENGMFSVRDPNSTERSERLWSYDELCGQIKGMWAIGANES